VLPPDHPRHGGFVQPEPPGHRFHRHRPQARGSPLEERSLFPDDALHDPHQGVPPPIERPDEPPRRPVPLGDERPRLRIPPGAQQAPAGTSETEARQRPVLRQDQPLALHALHPNIGKNVPHRVAADQPSRARGEAADLRQRRGQLGRGDAEPPGHGGGGMPSEVLEAADQPPGGAPLPSPRAELQSQALAEVTRPDPGRIQLLERAQPLLRDLRGEAQIGRGLFDRAEEPSPLVQATDEIRRRSPDLRRQVQDGELPGEMGAQRHRLGRPRHGIARRPRGTLLSGPGPAVPPIPWKARARLPCVAGGDGPCPRPDPGSRPGLAVSVAQIGRMAHGPVDRPPRTVSRRAAGALAGRLPRSRTRVPAHGLPCPAARGRARPGPRRPVVERQHGVRQHLLLHASREVEDRKGEQLQAELHLRRQPQRRARRDPKTDRRGHGEPPLSATGRAGVRDRRPGAGPTDHSRKFSPRYNFRACGSLASCSAVPVRRILPSNIR